MNYPDDLPAYTIDKWDHYILFARWFQVNPNRTHSIPAKLIGMTVSNGQRFWGKFSTYSLRRLLAAKLARDEVLYRRLV